MHGLATFFTPGAPSSKMKEDTLYIFLSIPQTSAYSFILFCFYKEGSSAGNSLTCMPSSDFSVTIDYRVFFLAFNFPPATCICSKTS